MVKPNSGVIVSAFTDEQVERLTGISRRRLHYWDRTKFFIPSLANKNRRTPYSRIFTFRDVVCLSILRVLRDEAKVSLPHLRGVKEKLSHLGDDLWAKTTLYALNKRVIFDNPETNAKEEVISGQGVLEIPLQVISRKIENAVRELNRRDNASIGKIERHRGIVRNQPVIAGTRIPVKSIKAFAKAGYSTRKIKKEYPSLTDEDIRAAVAYEDAAA